MQLLFRFLPWVRRTFPPWLLRVCAERAPLQAIRDLVDISDKVTAESRGILQEKESKLGEKAAHGDGEVEGEGEGKDLMSTLGA